MLADHAKRGVGDQRRLSRTARSYAKKPNLKFGESVSGRAFVRERAVTEADVQQAPDYSSRTSRSAPAIRSIASIPMMIKGEAIGVSTAITEKVHHFPQGKSC